MKRMLIMLSISPLNKIEITKPLTNRFRVFTGYLCNIDCSFCFYRNKQPKDIKEFIFKQMNIGRKFGMTGVDFSGGEPTILPYWFEILSHTKEIGFKNICSITNGFRYSNKDFLRKSVDFGLNDILFSLHGDKPEIHDELTGVHNSFDKIIRSMENAKELGIKYRINTVVSKYNYKIMPRLAELINQLNPSNMNFLPFRIETNAESHNLTNFTETIKYIKEAIDVLDKNIEINVRYVPFCMMKDYEKYVNTYIQRLFDSNEWSEYLFSKMDNIRDNKELLPVDFESSRLKLELEAMTNTIKDVCQKIPVCIKCKCKWICEGIWKSYINHFGEDEFNSIEGNDLYDPLYFRN